MDELKRQAIFEMWKTGNSKRMIAKSLQVDPKTVRRVLRSEQTAKNIQRKDKIQVEIELLKKLYERCEGYVQRVHECLLEEHQIFISYSTLTRLIRDLGLAKKPKKRSLHVEDVPGEEMQHDTSPYFVRVGSKKISVQASGLILRYSRMRYVKFYPCFTRFKMKSFLHEALTHWEFSAKTCVIDNTNLAILRGSGKNAIFNPEMILFSKSYGFQWFAHEIKHSDRKAGVERNFMSLNTNFFPGRTFSSLEDLNVQVRDWSCVRFANRTQPKTKHIPLEQFEIEKSYLFKVPKELPKPYREHKRKINVYGCVEFGVNFFWVPEKIGGKVLQGEITVLEESSHIHLYQKREKILSYDLPSFETRNKTIYPEGHESPKKARKSPLKKGPLKEEEVLMSYGDWATTYLKWAKKTKSMNQRHKFIRDLFYLSKKITPTLFKKTLERCAHYKIDSMKLIHRIATQMFNNEIQKSAVHLPASGEYKNRKSYRLGEFSSENPIDFQDNDRNKNSNDKD